jgi:WD40 repeat protein
MKSYRFIVSLASHVPGMMATCSIDKTVALWDTHNQDENSKTNFIPRACGSKDMKVGKLYTVGFYPSSPWLLGCGGSENNLALWDMSCEDALHARFGKRLDGGEEKAESQETDFEAAMAKNDSAQEDGKSRNSNKKKSKGGKKKAHKRGR